MTETTTPHPRKGMQFVRPAEPDVCEVTRVGKEAGVRKVYYKVFLADDQLSENTYECDLDAFPGLCARVIRKHGTRVH